MTSTLINTYHKCNRCGRQIKSKYSILAPWFLDPKTKGVEIGSEHTYHIGCFRLILRYKKVEDISEFASPDSMCQLCRNLLRGKLSISVFVMMYEYSDTTGGCIASYITLPLHLFHADCFAKICTREGLALLALMTTP